MVCDNTQIDQPSGPEPGIFCYSVAISEGFIIHFVVIRDVTNDAFR